MTVKERILMLRVIEKLKRNPGYAGTLVIEATGVRQRQNMESVPRGLTEL